MARVADNVQTSIKCVTVESRRIERWRYCLVQIFIAHTFCRTNIARVDGCLDEFFCPIYGGCTYNPQLTAQQWNAVYKLLEESRGVEYGIRIRYTRYMYAERIIIFKPHNTNCQSGNLAIRNRCVFKETSHWFFSIKWAPSFAFKRAPPSSLFKETL